jgi:hypothetical protein
MDWLTLVLVGWWLFPIQSVDCREYFGFVVSSPSLDSYSMIAYGSFDDNSEDGFKVEFKSGVNKRIAEGHDKIPFNELDLDKHIKAVIGEYTVSYSHGLAEYPLGGGINEYRDYFVHEAFALAEGSQFKGRSIKFFKMPLLFTTTGGLRASQGLNLTLKSIFSGPLEKVFAEWNQQKKAESGRAASSMQSRALVPKTRKASPVSTTSSRMPSFIRRSKLVASGQSGQRNDGFKELDCTIS